MPKTFLILSPNTHLAEATDYYLRQRGLISLGCFSSSAKAIHTARHQSPRFFITETHLLEESGYEAVRQLRRTVKTACVIWINKEQDCWQEALKADLSGYLDPTGGMGELEECLQTIQRGERYISPSLLKWLRPSPQSPLLSRLSARETQVLRLLAEGLENEDIAIRMAIQPGTVPSYFKTLQQKLGLSSTRHLLLFAARQFPV